MRHHDANRKFGLKKGPRRAFMRSLTRALVMESRIETTVPRAKELRPFVERLVTMGKGADQVSALRVITGRMGGQGDVARKIVKEIAPNYKSRNGGYTRILKLPNRASDNAPMALIEFV